MPEPLPSVDDIVQAFDHRSEADTGANQIRLHNTYELRKLVPLYVQAFPRIRNWIGRKYIVFWIARYARSMPAVVELAREALNDRSAKVRHDACRILAYALDEASLPLLRSHFERARGQTRDDIAATIKAIERKNHHLFLDRKGTGKVFWDPGRC